MSKFETIRQWKNPAARADDAEAKGHPAGAVQLSDEELMTVSGGTTDPYSAFHCPTAPNVSHPDCKLT